MLFNSRGWSLALQVIYGGGIHFSIQEHYRPPTGAAAGVFRKLLGFSWIHRSTVKHPMSRRQSLKTRCVPCSYFPFPQRHEKPTNWFIKATNLPPKKRHVFCPNCGCLSSGWSILRSWGNVLSLRHMFFFMLPLFGTVYDSMFVDDLKQLHKVMEMFFFGWGIELTGFPNKNVKGRIGKRRNASTETTLNSRAWHVENWRFLGNFITGFKLQILSFQMSHSVWSDSHLVSGAIRKQTSEKLGTNMNKSKQIQRVFNSFCCECWNHQWLPSSWDLFRSRLASLVARSSAFQVILGFGVNQVMMTWPIRFHQRLNQGQFFMVKYWEYMKDQELKWRSNDLHQIFQHKYHVQSPAATMVGYDSLNIHPSLSCFIVHKYVYV